jgi:hypothetical protein
MFVWIHTSAKLPLSSIHHQNYTTLKKACDQRGLISANLGIFSSDPDSWISCRVMMRFVSHLIQAFGLWSYVQGCRLQRRHGDWLKFLLVFIPEITVGELGQCSFGTFMTVLRCPAPCDIMQFNYIYMGLQAAANSGLTIYKSLNQAYPQLWVAYSIVEKSLYQSLQQCLWYRQSNEAPSICQ